MYVAVALIASTLSVVLISVFEKVIISYKYSTSTKEMQPHTKLKLSLFKGRCHRGKFTSIDATLRHYTSEVPITFNFFKTLTYYLAENWFSSYSTVSRKPSNSSTTNIKYCTSCHNIIMVLLLSLEKLIR